MQEKMSAQKNLIIIIAIYNRSNNENNKGREK